MCERSGMIGGWSSNPYILTKKWVTKKWATKLRPTKVSPILFFISYFPSEIWF